MDFKKNNEVNTSDFGSPIFNYKRIVFRLASDLKRLKDFAMKLDLKDCVASIDAIMTRIENDSFTIAVIGEFKRGKSTFINALLGQEICPADILPSTATINRITYGLKPAAIIRYKNGQEQEIPPDRLIEYVTKINQQAEAIATTIKEAVIYYPSQFCRNNVEIIDTPGLNDEANMDQLTFSILTKVDVVILVIMAESPFSELERSYVERFLNYDLGRVIFVLNAIDRINQPEDCERVVEEIKERISNYLLKHVEAEFGRESHQYQTYLTKIGTPKVFGLSAFQALTAKKQNNNELLNQSRFPQFENALMGFLERDRGLINLQTIHSRVQIASSEIIKVIATYQHQINDSKQKLSVDGSLGEITNLKSWREQVINAIDEDIGQITVKIKNLPPIHVFLTKVIEKIMDEAIIESAELDLLEPLTLELAISLANSIQDTSKQYCEKVFNNVDWLLEKELVQFEVVTARFLEAVNRIQTNLSSLNKLLLQPGNETVGIDRILLSPEIELAHSIRQKTNQFRVSNNRKRINSFDLWGDIFDPRNLIITRTGVINNGFFNINTQRLTTVADFKITYRVSVAEWLTKQLGHYRIGETINEQVLESIHQFQNLKSEIKNALERMIDEANRKTSGFTTRYEFILENEMQKLQNMKAETEKMNEDAHRLSIQLSEFANS